MQAFDRPPWEIIQIHGNGVIEGLGLIFFGARQIFLKFFNKNDYETTELDTAGGLVSRTELSHQYG